MSRVLSRSFLLAVFLAVSFFGGRAALAGAAQAEGLLAGQLVPSATPSMLGAITSAGRKGWDCKPEHAASATAWNAAELPTEPASN
jgi:hypothetical protein